MPRASLRNTGRLAIALALVACLPLHAQSSGRAPLTAGDVSAALAEANVHVSADHIQMPGSLSTMGADRQLRITEADLLPEARLRVRLTCRAAGACQPFMATVEGTSAAEIMDDLNHLQKLLQQSLPSHAVSPSGRVLAGQHATLLLEDSHMRIQLPVLVVDSGASGTEVRVSSLDRKQIYRGVVSDAATVRGNLP